MFGNSAVTARFHQFLKESFRILFRFNSVALFTCLHGAVRVFLWGRDRLWQGAAQLLKALEAAVEQKLRTHAEDTVVLLRARARALAPLAAACKSLRRVLRIRIIHYFSNAMRVLTAKLRPITDDDKAALSVAAARVEEDVGAVFDDVLLDSRARA